MGNESSLPMSCTEFDADEIRRLGKRFKKLVSINFDISFGFATISCYMQANEFNNVSTGSGVWTSVFWDRDS